MAGKQKRKGRWSSRSFFGLITSRKKIVGEISVPGLGDATADLREPNLASSATSSTPSSTAEKIRHRGSRLLSIVRLHGSASEHGSNQGPEGIRSPVSGSTPFFMQKGHLNGTDVTGSATTPTNKDTMSYRELKDASRTSSSEVQPHPQLSVAEEREVSAPVEDTRLIVVEALCKQSTPTRPRRSRSIPGIAHQLSHQLSATFSTPTIVHRISQQARPSIQSLHEHLASDLHVLPKVDTQSSTDPWSYGNSSGPLIGNRSTGKTSLSSNVPSLQAPKNRDRSERHERLVTQGTLAVNPGDTRESSLAPIEEKPEIVVPTIVTVESAANAKIFFETYFNALLSTERSPRSCRRHELEARLRMEAFTAEQCDRERDVWALQESDQLRRFRVLKSKPNARTGRSGASLAGFEIVKVLGKGSFGVVRLVRQVDSAHDEHPTQSPTTSAEQFRDILRSTLDSQRAFPRREVKRAKPEVYAMKVIRKSDMLRNSQEGHLKAERDFLVSSEKSRWVVPLIASFQDNTNLYLVMDYMVGGDFLGLLFRKDVLKEKKARWYVAEMILCVEEAHRLHWIHRDVKPDNFLISASGHLKISDFGLAFDGHWTHDQSFFNNHRQSLMEKLGIEVKGDSLDRKEGVQVAAGIALANAITGRKGRRQTPQTDAPGENEAILHWRNRVGNRKLARSVVGTSQYMAPELLQCLYGYTPFVCENRADTKMKILNNATTLKFPSEKDIDRKERISYEAMDLINSLLQETEHRLCSKVYRQNDYQITHLAAGQMVAARANKQSLDYQGHFVYPNDASDIKMHSFFHGLSWERLHLSRPPFVPDVKGRDDTKYFDEEEPVSDVDDASTICSAADTDKYLETSQRTAAAFLTTQLDGGMTTINSRGIEDRPGAAPRQVTKTAKPKEKKRPRDRALRDKEVGRTVMELRKKGAFPGYTYRRPKFSAYDEERGRQGGGRRSKLPSMN
ncbi:MAG: hypothetical protein Q9207_001642 [Kuettlingeria erythrocarpa]